MVETQLSFSMPSHPILRWLTDSGQDLSLQTRSALLGEIFNAPNALVAALINGMIFNGMGLYLSGSKIFGLYLVADCLVNGLLIGLVTRINRQARRNQRTPTDAFLITAVAWGVVEGAMAFSAMMTHIPSFQIIAAATIMGLVGMVCARNYAAPRFALLLIILCSFPFVAGAALSGDPWLLILLWQTPLLLYGYFTVVTRFQAIAMTTMQADQHNHYRARHDHLTGLLNRLGLTEALMAQYQNASRFVMFYLDLDGFKPINDTFGHDAGDKLLQAVATRLNGVVRSNDIVARLGGDEFVIVAADMSAAAGTSMADSIISRIGSEPYLIEPFGPLRVGVSVGFACAPEDGLIGDDLHRKADAALYEAKEAGRGTHRRFGPATAIATILPVMIA